MVHTPKTMDNGNSGIKIGIRTAMIPNNKQNCNTRLLKRPRMKFLNSENLGLGDFSFCFVRFIQPSIKQNRYEKEPQMIYFSLG